VNAEQLVLRLAEAVEQDQKRPGLLLPTRDEQQSPPSQTPIALEQEVALFEFGRIRGLPQGAGRQPQPDGAQSDPGEQRAARR
jgi:hypothetical protein